MSEEINKVEIVPNDLGAKIRVSANNPEYAHVLLRQQKTVISPNGWVRSKTLHALLHGKVESIQDIGIATLETLPGQIVVKEQLVPFNTDNPDADYKYAGDTGIVCCKHGEPIYRKCFYDPTMLETDELVSHTNSDDIRAAMLPDGVEVKAEEDQIASMISPSMDTEEEEVDPRQTNILDAIADITHEPQEEEEEKEEDVPVVHIKEHPPGENTEVEASNPFDDEDEEEDVKIADMEVEDSNDDEEVEEEVEEEEEVEVDDDMEFNL